MFAMIYSHVDGASGLEGHVGIAGGNAVSLIQMCAVTLDSFICVMTRLYIERASGLEGHIGIAGGNAVSLIQICDVTRDSFICVL